MNLRSARCCGVIAFICALAVVARTQTPNDTRPTLFPARLAWTLPLNNVLAALPTFSQSRGYFPIDGKRLAAYDVEHGILLWLARAETSLQVAVGDGRVYVAAPDAIEAIDEETGAVVWRSRLAEPLTVPPVWDNGWLIGATAGSVIALRALDGEAIWTRPIDSPVRSRPALAADRVYLALEDGRILALGVERGDEVWQRRLSGPPNDVLALEDRLFVGSNDNNFYCLNTTDGSVVWRWPTGADVVGLPSIDGHSVYFASFDNVLRALDRRTGVQRWKRALPFRPTHGPVRTGDMLVISGIAPHVGAFRIRDGNPAGEFLARGELAAPPYVLEGAALPMAIIVTRDITAGTEIAAVVRTVEPPVSTITPLPNPTAPPTPPPSVPAPPAAQAPSR